MARRNRRRTAAGQKKIRFIAVVGGLGYFEDIVDIHWVDTELCRTWEASIDRESLGRSKVNQEYDTHTSPCAKVLGEIWNPPNLSASEQ